MSLIGNIIWILLGGIWTALGWLLLGFWPRICSSSVCENCMPHSGRSSGGMSEGSRKGLNGSPRMMRRSSSSTV